MLQAIGLSGKQTVNMLQLEGLFYTAGTLVLSLGLGSLLGYLAFLWGKGRRDNVHPDLSLSGRAGNYTGSGGTACAAADYLFG